MMMLCRDVGSIHIRFEILSRARGDLWESGTIVVRPFLEYLTQSSIVDWWRALLTFWCIAAAADCTTLEFDYNCCTRAIVVGLADDANWYCSASSTIAVLVFDCVILSTSNTSCRAADLNQKSSKFTQSPCKKNNITTWNWRFDWSWIF